MLLAAASVASESAATAAAKRFCARMGISSPSPLTARRKESARNGSIRWDVSGGNKIFSVDDASMEVILYVDADQEAACRMRASGELPGVYRNQSAAVAVAQGILQILSPGHSMRLHSFKADGGTSYHPNLPRRNAVTVILRESDENGGIHPVGNFLEVVLNGSTGKIVSVNIQRHWTYEPREIVLTAEQAKSAARSILAGVELALISNDPTVTSHYLIPVSGFGCTIASAYQRMKRARYAYCVRFEKVIVFVDAQDGKSLGGIRKS